MLKTPIKLFGRALFSRPGPRRIVRIGDPSQALWHPSDVLLRSADAPPPPPPDAGVVLSFEPPESECPSTLYVTLPPELHYISTGDVLRLDPASGAVNMLFRKSGRNNSLLLTERCNSNCVMCSQPPRERDDSFIVDDLLEAIPLIDSATTEIGFTGGEPTLLHSGFLKLVAACKEHLPRTSLHVLSNGRLFAYREYAQLLGAIDHHDIMIGIPLYSDLPWSHDFVVQAHNAFDQTIRGMLNLARFDVPIELRVVIHRSTYERLPDLARFIGRNLPFVSQVALMGLELMGHVKMNLDAVWVDPLDYQDQLSRCVLYLSRCGIPTRIYNHQLCTIPADLRPFAVRSISDWKNVYAEECDACGLREECGGFFASSELRRSKGIHPILSPLSHPA